MNQSSLIKEDEEEAKIINMPEGKKPKKEKKGKKKKTNEEGA